MGYLGAFEQLVLFSVVKLGDQAYGGAIREAIEERTARVVSSGAINTALSRLAEYFVEMKRDYLANAASRILGQSFRDDPNAQIARALVVSPRTVEMHVANILAALDSRTRAEAVRRATELGLL